MTRFSVFFSRVRALFTKRRSEAQLNDEIQTHLALLVEENLRAGMSIGDARAAARREFGGVDQVKEAYRDQRALPFVETIAQDIRYAMRTFRRGPGFVVAVVLWLTAPTLAVLVQSHQWQRAMNSPASNTSSGHAPEVSVGMSAG